MVDSSAQQEKRLVLLPVTLSPRSLEVLSAYGALGSAGAPEVLSGVMKEP